MTNQKTLRQIVSQSICKSGKFETGEGTCALACMDQLVTPRDMGCRHCEGLFGKLADSILEDLGHELDKNEPVYAEAADRLWKETETDWYVSVSHTLTEPVCAIVSLWSDDDSLPAPKGFIGCYDVNESIKRAIEHLLDVVLKKEN